MEKETKSEEKRMSYKNRVAYKTIVMWLCGLWALGLGARMSLELLLSNTGIFIPRDILYGVNIWFDFIPLCVFGSVTVFYTTKELFKAVQAKGWVDV